jgi:hypothetical protein
LFINPGKPDDSGMPLLLDAEVRQDKIKQFLQGIPEESLRKEVGKRLFALNKIIQNGKSAREAILEGRTAPEKQRVFLKGFAYTLMVIRDVPNNAITVNFVPRLMSTGNLLASLGLHKTMREEAPAAWLDRRLAVESDIRKAFQDKSST